MGWYLEQRRYVENEVRKYSDPPSDRLLPDLPAHARCGPSRAAALGCDPGSRTLGKPHACPIADQTAQPIRQHGRG